MLSFTKASIADTSSADGDDKYVKAATQPGSVSKTLTSFQIYVCFLMACSVVYYYLGGDIRIAASEDKLSYLSCLAEGLGLLSLRIKISRQGSVTGISGMTMVMYAIVYFLRLFMVCPDQLSVVYLDGWAVEALQIASLLMVLDVVHSVFITYRKSYQEDLDVLHIKYLIPTCVVLAAILHPQFHQGTWFSFSWTTYLYHDCLALMPQVVMLTRGAGKVEAPVAHFVAATTLSRVMDLSFWYYDFDLGAQGFYHGFNYSGWLIVFWHVINLAIVADFMYYYMKAHVSGRAVSANSPIPLDV